MKQQLLNKRIAPIGLTCAYFLFLALFVSLSGNFPLNDDWSYGEGVRNLLNHGQVVMPTVCAIGFTHVYLGAFFCKLFGFSYVTLRTITFIVGLAGTLALYGALREFNTRRSTATFCALVYASNPLMVNLYFSFMSDTTALSLMSFYFYILLRAIKKNSFALAIFALVIFLLAIGARQSVVIFLPCNLALLSLQTKNRRLAYLLVAASLALPIFSYIATDHWLMNRSDCVRDYIDSRVGHAQFIKSAFSNSPQWFYNLLLGAGQTACYMGLFSAPILLAFISKSRILLSKYFHQLWFWFLLSACTILSTIKELVIAQHKLMPFNQNLLRLPMVCALTILGLNMPLLSNKSLRWVTIISFILAFVLLTILGASVSWLFARGKQLIELQTASIQERAIVWKKFALIWVCVVALITSVGFSVIETIVSCTDRYYLIALAPLVLSLTLIARLVRLKIIQPASVIALVLIALFSACAAQDYLGWNRARWLGLEQLEAKGIPSSEIDGGVEYNTMRDIQIYRSTNHGAAPQNKWRWWSIKGEKYIVSFSPIENYKVIEHLPYWSALTFSNLEVLVLQREDSK